MSVDFYPCSSCGDTYCDCGEYVTCNEETGGCGRDWCSNDCATDEGYMECSCKIGTNISCDGSPEDDCEFVKKTAYGSDTCEGCKNFVGASCNFCRNEDYEDTDLLNKALGILRMSRSELIERMKVE